MVSAYLLVFVGVAGFVASAALLVNELFVWLLESMGTVGSPATPLPALGTFGTTVAAGLLIASPYALVVGLLLLQAREVFG